MMGSERQAGYAPDYNSCARLAMLVAMLVGCLSDVYGGIAGPDSVRNKTFSLWQHSRQLTAATFHWKL